MTDLLKSGGSLPKNTVYVFQNPEKEPSMEHQSATLLKEGMAALDAGNTALALQRLQAAAELDESPEILSHFAYCVAKELQDYRRAEALCGEAIDEEPWYSAHYLNLGRIRLLEGRREDAIRVFRDGLLREANPRIKAELERLGIRKYPIISSLPREHFLNKYLGKFLTALKLR